MAFEAIDFEEFRANQREIYEKNEGGLDVVRREGVAAGDVVKERNRGSYLVALRHPVSVTNPLGEFSRRIASTTPAQVFDGRNAHTSLFVYRLEKTNFKPDEEVLDVLAASVGDVWTRLKTYGSQVLYNGWFVNRDSVVAKGYGGIDFTEAVNVIGQAAYNRGLTGIMDRTPWGGQITANRFVADRSPEELEEVGFFEAVEFAPRLGRSESIYLDVGYSQINGVPGVEGFKYIVDGNRRFEF